MQRKGNTLYNVLDRYTGAMVSYNKVLSMPGGTAITDAMCDGVLYRKLGVEYFKRSDVTKIFPEWFGVTGNGVTDDTAAWQNMFDKIFPNSTIILSSGAIYNISTATLIKTGVNIEGNQATILGTIKIGDSTGRSYNSYIKDCRFTTTSSAIQLLNTRRIGIHGNYFSGCNKAVDVIAGANNSQHVNAQIEVTQKNVFTNVNYCLYVDRTPASTWQTTSDCTFSGNIANNCNITAIYCEGIDGIKVVDNVFFCPSGSVNKKHHIRINTQSDWVVVSSNNFFESGEESIYVESCKGLNVKANNFAWCGQKGVYDVISLNGNVTDYNVNISGNIFDGFSGNAISSSATAYGVLDCTGNSISYSNTYTGYFGSTDLSTINHYILNLGSGFTKFSERNTFDYTVVNLKRVKIGDTLSTSITRYEANLVLTSITKVFTIVASTTSIISNFRSGSQSVSNIYSGELLIVVRQSLTSTANTATYKLMVSRFNSSIKVIEIFRAGLTNGVSSSHPSFVFSIDTSGNLLATPLGLTAGTFYFMIKSEGDLILNEL